MTRKMAPVWGRDSLARRGLNLARRSAAELCLQRRNPRLQRLVLFARQAGHFLDRLEFLALDHVEIAQDAFGLVAHDGVDLALDALGRARGIVHQTADLVEEAVGG